MTKKILSLLIFSLPVFLFFGTGLAEERVCVGPVLAHSREFQFEIRPARPVPGKGACPATDKELKVERKENGLLLFVPVESEKEAPPPANP